MGTERGTGIRCSWRGIYRDKAGLSRIKENQEVMAGNPEMGYVGKRREKEGYFSTDVNKC
jgi:hypothetical protein